MMVPADKTTVSLERRHHDVIMVLWRGLKGAATGSLILGIIAFMVAMPD